MPVTMNFLPVFVMFINSVRNFPDQCTDVCWRDSLLSRICGFRVCQLKVTGRKSRQNDIVGTIWTFGCVSAGGCFSLCEWISQRRTRVYMFDYATEPQRRCSWEFTATVPDNHFRYDLHTWPEHHRLWYIILYYFILISYITLHTL